MYKAYKFRLYPNDNQKKLINKTFGCTRLIYNHFLNKCKEEKFIKAYDMCKELKELVLDYPFLKEVDSYYPSSKTCSHCDSKTEITNDLKIRVWECKNCGNTNDRNINASINIMFEGIKKHFAS